MRLRAAAVVVCLHLRAPLRAPFSTNAAAARRPADIWTAKMEAAVKYKNWTKDNLLLRIAELESRLDDNTAQPAETSVAVAEQVKAEQRKTKAKIKREKPEREGVNFARAPTRKIALRFSYDGALYSGLAAQNSADDAPLPTVESVLWHALCKGRLVDPALGMDGAGFSRCGRTDRGVSAAGQVVALWVRSRKVNLWHERRQVDALRPDTTPTATPEPSPEQQPPPLLQDEEIPYVQILNRILPPTIRIQAWSPVRSTFSARFDCVYRHYKYFFTAGPPSIFFPPGSAQPGAATTLAGCNAADTRLDIDLMRQAAHKLLGEHDFRNLCKIDASKQISNYRRRVDGVSIDPVGADTHWPTSGHGDETERMYVLNLRGTAFLYHQVRNIMAILFLVGARLEKPTVIEELMNTEHGRIAADRVRARLLALKTYGQEDDDASVQELEKGDLLGGEVVRGLRWWMPVNPTDPLPPAVADRRTPTRAEKEALGLPLWIEPALLPTSESAHAESDAGLEVYETKPNYEMAADRPLVLWECGFLPTDVQWRVGAYDGGLPPIGDTDAQGDTSLKSASVNALRLHKEWIQLAISTELTRHLTLATASPHTGFIPSRTRYDSACFPHFPTATPAQTPAQTQTQASTSRTIPLGNGQSKGSHDYQPLSSRTREQHFETRNAKWLQQSTRKRATATHPAAE